MLQEEEEEDVIGNMEVGIEPHQAMFVKNKENTKAVKGGLENEDGLSEVGGNVVKKNSYKFCNGG